ncbi:MAG: EamA family transporter [Desulfurivibrionaceae bacterium]|nr:EamA family transporter [Desulfobulbales bacterium]MDT8334318.1 EamA family transporter [Desulfurivibrionaceae bacterium]
MLNWLPIALASLVLFGLWGFFPKIAVAYLDPRSAMVYHALGTMLVGLVVLFSLKLQPDFHPRGVLFALLTGMAGFAGTLCFFMAADRGRISLVVSITALYPLVTILLAAIFLKEALTVKQLSGMACAVIAILLMSS